MNKCRTNLQSGAAVTVDRLCGGAGGEEQPHTLRVPPRDWQYAVAAAVVKVKEAVVSGARAEPVEQHSAQCLGGRMYLRCASMDGTAVSTRS